MFEEKIIKLVKMDFRNDRMWEIIAAYLCGEEVEAADFRERCPFAEFFEFFEKNA